MLSIFLSILFSVTSFSVTSAHAYLTNAKLPACLDGREEMRIDNARVLKFKTTTRNQYLDRAFVEGKVIEAPGVKNGHDHFAIAIGPGRKDTLEIIYNKEFGSMPNVNIGDRITVCGDYITSSGQSGSYPPSPEGAIIHWVHFNPGSRQSSADHSHGFIAIENTLIGFDEAPSGAWSGEVIKVPEPKAGRVRSSRDSVPSNEELRDLNARSRRRERSAMPSRDRGTDRPLPDESDDRYDDRNYPGERDVQDDFRTRRARERQAAERRSREEDDRYRDGRGDPRRDRRRQSGPSGARTCRSLRECSARNR